MSRESTKLTVEEKAFFDGLADNIREWLRGKTSQEKKVWVQTKYRSWKRAQKERAARKSKKQIMDGMDEEFEKRFGELAIKNNEDEEEEKEEPGKKKENKSKSPVTKFKKGKMAKTSEEEEEEKSE